MISSTKGLKRKGVGWRERIEGWTVDYERPPGVRQWYWSIHRAGGAYTLEGGARSSLEGAKKAARGVVAKHLTADTETS